VEVVVGMNARGLICLIAWLLGFSAPQPADGAVNEWIKPTSGYWKSRLPGHSGCCLTHADVVFANAGWKALAIGTNAAQSFPQSMERAITARGCAR